MSQFIQGIRTHVRSSKEIFQIYYRAADSCLWDLCVVISTNTLRDVWEVCFLHFGHISQFEVADPATPIRLTEC